MNENLPVDQTPIEPIRGKVVAARDGENRAGLPQNG